MTTTATTLAAPTMSTGSATDRAVDGSPRIVGRYGEAPVAIGPRGSLDLTKQWTEFMHYLYLPVRIPAHDLRSLPEGVTKADGDWARIPAPLWFLRDSVLTAMRDARETAPHLADPYVYITARRGFATPGNPLNRPGMHCDDFGGSDLNYIWADKWGTRFVRSAEPLTLPTDDTASMEVMDHLGASAEIEWLRWEAKRQFNGNAERPALWMEHGDVNTMLRLSPYVIHDTPLITEPGGMRSFFKISVSTERYDLVGNSHNYDLDYDWPMVSRRVQRNKPQGGNADYSQKTP